MNGLTRFANGSLAQFGMILAGVMALCLLTAGLSELGLAGNLVAYLFVFCGLVLIAAFCRWNTPTSMAGSGVTVGVEWLSAFGLFGIVGAVYSYGHDGLAVLLGLAAGFLVSMLFVAPRLCIIPAPSVPDFLMMRYGSEALRYITLGVLALVTMLFLAAQVTATGLIAEHIFRIPSFVGIAVGAAAILALAISARRGTVSTAQVFMAVLTIAALVFAALWLLTVKTGIFVPQLAAGGLFTDITAAESRLGLDARFGSPFEGLGLTNTIFVVIVLATGSAVMPHLIGRSLATEDPRQTEQTLRRGLIIFVVIATLLPAFAVLMRAEILALFVDAKNAVPVSAFSDAVLRQMPTVSATLSADQFALQPDAVFPALPELNGSSGWMLGLFSLAGLAVAAGAGASAVYRLADAVSSRTPSSEAAGERSLTIAIVTVVAALISAISGLGVLSFGALAYSLISASLFAPLVLGLWWRRTTRAGAISGMLGGFAITAVYLLGAGLGIDFMAGSENQGGALGAPHLSAGLFGLVASFFLTVIVSTLGEEPPLSQLDIMDRLDAPPLKVGPESLE